ncbi:hypothetical protein AB9P05_04540 [Roseivirga sp. BDSF3-8]|uniref:hypothetical protein n=1 Tax=Roseivirga sp. BDSF3-8 TaxID=3241598 RepID=UPI003531A38A
MSASNPQYAVVITSIGNASPARIKPVAEKLEMPYEFMLRLIYNAPVVFVRNLDAESAPKAAALLRQIGLEATHMPAEEVPVYQNPRVDVSLYLHDVLQLPATVKSLAEFIGCPYQEAMKVLNNYPALVLGGVSPATAEALASRVNAEVTYADPTQSAYTLEVAGTDRMVLHQVHRTLSTMGVALEPGQQLFRGLTYTQGQTVWKKFQSTGAILLMNQSFERYEVLLDALDQSVPGHRRQLVNLTGMPEEIVDEVLENLPVQLEASVSAQHIEQKLKDYQTAGLLCSSRRLTNTPRQLMVDEIQSQEQARKVLSRFVPADQLPHPIRTPWQAPVPLSDLMARYAVQELEAAGCDADYEDFTL